MKKKHLTTILLMMLVAALSVGATLAYLTDKDANVNTFTVGNVNLKLDEAKVNEYGEVIEGEKRVTENTYKLIPGHTYVKDPTVTVEKGSEPSYVRMLVKFNKATVLQELFGTPFLPQNFVTGWNSEKWKSTGNIIANGDNLIYEFWYCDVVDAREEERKLEALFEKINFPETVTAEQLQKLEGLVIDIEAHAIQADGFENADAAWAAFE